MVSPNHAWLQETVFQLHARYDWSDMNILGLNGYRVFGKTHIVKRVRGRVLRVLGGILEGILEGI